MNFNGCLFHLLCLLPLPSSISKRQSKLFQRNNRDTIIPLAFVTTYPPPRFDQFTDNILGSWQEHVFTVDNRLTGRTLGEVKEVMRSCGGAIQGIKEVALNQGNERFYHNRANDGFLYFDCGSYVSVPTKISATADDTIDLLLACNTNTVCSFSFPTVPKTRMILTSNPPSCQSLCISDNKYSIIDSIASTEMEKDDSKEDFIFNNKPLIAPRKSIQWKKGVTCKMPCPGQQWMLQRASWEQILHDTDDDDDNNINLASKNEKNTREQNQQKIITASQIMMQGWISTYQTDNLDESAKLFLWGENDDFARCIPEDTFIILQMGSHCMLTQEARAFLCYYGADGELKGVTMQEGRVKM